MMPLKNVLLINGVSSGVTGVGLLLFADFFSGLFQINSVALFAGVGIFLIAFAGFVIMVALGNTNRSKVQVIITLDILWTLTSFLLVVVANREISTMGNTLILAVAIWVAAMAFLQTKGLKQITLN
ncbi:hypothetical protein WSM22_45000 [Cytophagales bacterium WSM2-2]|nr:hypothetical protein WSM22_45000 [Cytophagales bacterium WSM2-2]